MSVVVCAFACAGLHRFITVQRGAIGIRSIRAHVRATLKSEASCGWQLPSSWATALEGLLDPTEFNCLRASVTAERNKFAVLPREEEQLAAFHACAFDDVRVVLLGQDPYPTEGNAMGLSFSVRRGTPLPASLRNMYLELQADLNIAPATHGCLDEWAHQGVFLLNSVLTVRKGEPGSHSNMGWDTLTDAALKALSTRRRGIVFFLWGSAAISKARLIDSSAHLILEAPHPSPLSARRGFFGCRHFSKANAFLSKHGQAPINWKLSSQPEPDQSEPDQSEQLKVVVDARAARARREIHSIVHSLVFALDTETTGVDVNQDRVVQLGAVYWRGAQREGARRSMLVNPGIPIPEGATNVHGITNEDVAEAPNFAVVGKRLLPHLFGEATEDRKPPILCGYNALSFDIPLLNAEFSRHSIDHQIDPSRVLDPFIWVSWHLRHLPRRSLGAVAAHYGVPLTEAHSAAADSEATAAVLLHLVSSGLIPDDLEVALLHQERLQITLEKERTKYAHYLYHDRSSGTAIEKHDLRVGFGKYIGALLDAVAANDPSYLLFFLSKNEEEGSMPVDACREIQASLTRTQLPDFRLPSVPDQSDMKVSATEGGSDGKGEVTKQMERKPPPKRVSPTDNFDTVEGKLAYRMHDGFFEVLDLEEYDPEFDDWKSFPPHLKGLEAYAIRPLKGGYRYLENVKNRLNKIGFQCGTHGIWMRPKVIDGVEQLIDLETLELIKKP